VRSSVLLCFSHVLAKLSLGYPGVGTKGPFLVLSIQVQPF